MGCRRRAPAGELVRVVRDPDGSLQIGRTLAGRGAWLCAGSPRCVQRASQRNAFSKALRAPVSPEAVQALQPGSAG
ncbi:MAG: YlxR family protein [Acidimicrobiales bacterium]